MGTAGEPTLTRPNVPDYMNKNGNVYRFVVDHLGSVRLVVNTADGSVAPRIDYDEFGAIVSDTAPGFQPFCFAGGIYDPDTEFVRFGARDYDAVVGRWTAKDPILFASGRPNVYGYCGNDPINRIDSNGLNDRSWPLNGQITNHSSNTVWGYDYDHDTFVPVAPNSESSNDVDVAFVEVHSCLHDVNHAMLHERVDLGANNIARARETRAWTIFYLPRRTEN